MDLGEPDVNPERCFHKASELDTKKVYGIMMIANPLTTGSKCVDSVKQLAWKFEKKWTIYKILKQ